MSDYDVTADDLFALCKEAMPQGKPGNGGYFVAALLDHYGSHMSLRVLRHCFDNPATPTRWYGTWMANAYDDWHTMLRRIAFLVFRAVNEKPAPSYHEQMVAFESMWLQVKWENKGLDPAAAAAAGGLELPVR